MRGLRPKSDTDFSHQKQIIYLTSIGIVIVHCIYEALMLLDSIAVSLRLCNVKNRFSPFTPVSDVVNGDSLHIVSM